MHVTFLHRKCKRKSQPSVYKIYVFPCEQFGLSQSRSLLTKEMISKLKTQIFCLSSTRWNHRQPCKCPVTGWMGQEEVEFRPRGRQQPSRLLGSFSDVLQHNVKAILSVLMTACRRLKVKDKMSATMPGLTQRKSAQAIQI